MLDVVLEGSGRRGILVDDCPARALVREVGRVDPVVERPAEIEHAEEDHEEERRDERKLDERDAVLLLPR